MSHITKFSDHITATVFLHVFMSDREKKAVSNRLGHIFDSIRFIDAENEDGVEECRQIKIHYGLHGIYFNYSSLDFFFEKIEDINEEFLAALHRFCQTISKKTLLYLGKFPTDEGDMDGGSQLSYQLIESLKHKTILDLCFIRKGNQEFSSTGIHNISYEPYINPFGNKFQRRLQNLVTNKKAIRNGVEYDLIIAAHCSKLFGLQNDREIMSKSVIFPMFLTQSYVKANEDVPEEYTALERLVLRNVSLILTPSSDEKDDMISFYDVPAEKIRVIPRGISPTVTSHIKECEQIKLISIGSIKEQKNHMDDLLLLDLLLKKNFEASLVIAGSVYDLDVMHELQEFIKRNNLSSRVSFVSGLSRQGISDLLEQMTFGISNSRWETFGRGIFECLASGLPTLVSDSLTTVHRLSGEQKGISFHRDIQSMAEKIIDLYKSPDLYRSEANGALQIAENFSYATERERLLYALVFDRFCYSSFFSLWNLDQCEKIYDGRYSICYRNNGHVRKYLRFKEAKYKAKEEFLAAHSAHLHSIPTPQPHFVGYDCKVDKFFIDFSDSPCEMCTTFTDDELGQLDEVLRRMRSLPVIRNNWQQFVDEFSEILLFYEKVFNDDVSYDISLLKSLPCSSFVHGDFWRQNIGIDSNGKIVVFDFQNSCNGPANWDLCYLYANIPFPKIPVSRKDSFTLEDIAVIQIILKIRIARMYKKELDYSDLHENLISWRNLDRNRK